MSYEKRNKIMDIDDIRDLIDAETVILSKAWNGNLKVEVYLGGDHDYRYFTESDLQVDDYGEVQRDIEDMIRDIRGKRGAKGE